MFKNGWYVPGHIQKSRFYLLTRGLAAEEFVAVDPLATEPERMNGNRYGDTDRFWESIGGNKTRERDHDQHKIFNRTHLNLTNQVHLR